MGLLDRRAVAEAGLADLFLLAEADYFVGQVYFELPPPDSRPPSAPLHFYASPCRAGAGAGGGVGGGGGGGGGRS